MIASLSLKNIVLLCSLWLVPISGQAKYADSPLTMFNVSSENAQNSQRVSDPYVAAKDLYKFQAMNYREPYMTKAAVNALFLNDIYPLILSLVRSPWVMSLYAC